MIVVTTSISGSSRDGYSQRFMRLTGSLGKKVKEFHVGDMLLEHAKLIGIRMTPKNVLNTNKQALSAIRSAVFEKILSEVPDLLKDGYSIVVHIHTAFFWKHRYELAFDFHYIRRLNPDFFVNFIDDADSIVNILSAREQWHQLLFAGRDREYTIDRILEWQSVEFEYIKGITQLERKKLFVIPSKANENILYRLMFEPWRKSFYLGMALTLLHGDEYADARQRIDDMASWLNQYVIVVDPRYVEPLTPEHLAKINPSVYNQVVARDLYWLIPQCDGMVAFFPEVAFSAGVNNELREVHETSGDTMLIYPEGKAVSPFLIVWSDNTFRHEKDFREAFLRYLGEEYMHKVSCALADALRG